MEAAILICLMLVIVLLLHDKIIINDKSPGLKSGQQKANPALPDIMGQPKPKKSPSLPHTSNNSLIEEAQFDPADLDIEYDDNEIRGIQIPQEALDEAFGNTPAFEEEEEEWDRYGIASDGSSLAQGVTFEELTSVGTLLQKDKLETDQKKTALAILQKLQGTELLDLLENSMEGTSRKIASLLDSALSSETATGHFDLGKKDLNDFDIGDFI